MAEIPSLKHTVKITEKIMVAARPVAATRARDGAAGSKGPAEVAMTAVATLLAGAGVGAASTAAAGRVHPVKSAAGATLVTELVALQPAPLATARNKATAGGISDMVGAAAAAAIAASNGAVAEGATSLAEPARSKARAAQRVEEVGDGTAGRMMGGTAIAAVAKMRGVPGSTVRRGIDMATKRGVKTAASGMGEVRIFLPAARATMGVMIVTEGTPFITGDLRHQSWRSCRHWMQSTSWLQSMQHHRARHQRSARWKIWTVLPQHTATRNTASRCAMGRQTPN